VTIRAGVPPPPPDDLEDVGEVHAIDGDGTALCLGNLAVEPVDSYLWTQVPAPQRCTRCSLIMESGAAENLYAG
jgi:hypothetical protein